MLTLPCTHVTHTHIYTSVYSNLYFYSHFSEIILCTNTHTKCPQCIPVCMRDQLWLPKLRRYVPQLLCLRMIRNLILRVVSDDGICVHGLRERVLGTNNWQISIMCIAQYVCHNISMYVVFHVLLWEAHPVGAHRNEH